MKMDRYDVCLSIFMMCNLITYLASSRTTNVNGTLVEMCSAPIFFNPSAGCPIYNGSINLLYDRCTADKGCPPHNSTKYMSLAQLFKYPACLRLPTYRSDLSRYRSSGHFASTSLSTGFSRSFSPENNSTSFELTLDTIDARSRRPYKEKSTELLLLENPVLKTAGFLILGNIIIIVVLVKMIKKRERKASTFQGAEMSNLQSESVEQIYYTVNETFLTEAV